MNHRIKWENEEDTTVDEVFAKDATVHLERMDDGHLYLGVTADDGTLYQVYLQATSPIASFAYITNPEFCPPTSTSMFGNPGCSTCFTQQINHRVNVGELQGIDILRAQMHRGMFTCPNCGNKRCPKASDHRNDCPAVAE